MDLIIKSANFVNQFNDLSKDDLNVSLELSLNGLILSFRESTFLLSRMKIKDGHDLENFIYFCNKVREKGE